MVIDGHGTAFLSPGLADMHTHSTTSRDMLVYLASGVTTVLNMGGATYGFVDHVVPRTNRGDLPGPHIYLSLCVDGTPEFGQLVVTTSDQARSVVDLAKTNGYDFIKVYNNLSPEVFQAFIEEGKRQAIPVVGHGITRVGIENQLSAGQLMVAHAEEYLYTVFFPAGAEVGNRAPRLEQIPAAVAFTKRYGAFVTADLNTYATISQQWGNPAAVEAFLEMPEVKYLDPDERIAWRSAGYDTRTGNLDERLAFARSLSWRCREPAFRLLPAQTRRRYLAWCLGSHCTRIYVHLRRRVCRASTYCPWLPVRLGSSSPPRNPVSKGLAPSRWAAAPI